MTQWQISCCYRRSVSVAIASCGITEAASSTSRGASLSTRRREPRGMRQMSASDDPDNDNIAVTAVPTGG